jgi:predicted phage terminase large subunit-like protein
MIQEDFVLGGTRKDREDYLKAQREVEIRALRDEFKQPGGLLRFVRYFWKVLEPKAPLVEGKALEAICLHLEAVTDGRITHLLINVPPGFMKSLLVNVFWPAWEWSCKDSSLRYVTFSYAASLTTRDNGKFRDLILSREHQEIFGREFAPRKIGEEKVSNNKTGWKLASSVGGVGTGERGDRIIVDDPHNVKESESDVVRQETVRWFRESLSSRINNEKTAFVVIMQRVHEADVSGTIIKDFPKYTHLFLQMEFDPKKRCKTKIGWEDWRTYDGELAWEDRFNAKMTAALKTEIGSYGYAGQYQQTPEVRGGGILKRHYWRTWQEKRYPVFEYLLASLDTAYTEKQNNDPSAMTVWGVFRDKEKNTRLMLVYAWEAWAQIHELVQSVNWICSPKWKPEVSEEVLALLKKLPRFPVHKLIIESKASGISAGQELHRLFGGFGTYSIELLDPKKLGGGDKVARVHAVEPLFESGMVFAPATRFAEKVIDQAAKFPRAEHDDLTDTVSQALRYLRETGLIARKEEHARDFAERAAFQPEPPSLYGY